MLILFCSERTCSIHAGHFGVALWPRVASRPPVNELINKDYSACLPFLSLSLAAMISSKNLVFYLVLNQQCSLLIKNI